MKKFFTLISAVLGLLLALALAGPSGGPDSVRAQETDPLPESLDKLYPPAAHGPMWLLSMFGLGTAFSGMVTDFMEGDFANAQQGYADFRDRYAKLPQLVPEWAMRLPSETMDALGVALESRDPAQFMPAVDRASMVCHNCHVENMTRVQQKYHWDDFGVITLTDPPSKQDMPFRIFMRMLDGDLAGVQVDLAQGQVDAARQHALGMAARYQTLRDACVACHDSERSYYVDSNITGMIDKLGIALESDRVDRNMVQELVERIGMESCHRCHLVHGPAALARYAHSPSK